MASEPVLDGTVDGCMMLSSGLERDDLAFSKRDASPTRMAWKAFSQGT
jgi:hypothetical protein